jgi:hypothetical protein
MTFADRVDEQTEVWQRSSRPKMRVDVTMLGALIRFTIAVPQLLYRNPDGNEWVRGGDRIRIRKARTAR